MVPAIWNTLQQRYPRLFEIPTYSHGVWSYDFGVVLMGVRRLYEKTGDEAYLRYMEENLSPYIGKDGSIRYYEPETYNIDYVNNGKILVALYEATGEARYMAAMEQLVNQLATHPRTSEGAFWHKLIYPSQIWLDGLYMGSPFWAEYLLRYKNGEGLDDVIRQFEISFAHNWDPDTGLLYHAWDEARVQPWCDPATGLSPHMWGRAVGWYAMALVDVLELLPEGHPGRAVLQNILEKTAGVIRDTQQPNGVWYQVLDCPGRRGNYYEASASCMFTAALARAVNLGLLPAAEWAPLAQKAWQGVQQEFVFTTKEGWVNLCRNCAVAGLGGADKRDGSFTYYISEPIITNDMKGYGAFLQAAIAMEELGE